jgi:transposase
VFKSGRDFAAWLGPVEMTRHLKVARDTAVKSRRQAMVTLKTIIINAPAALRQTLDCTSVR